VVEPHELWGQGRAFEARYLFAEFARDDLPADEHAVYRHYLSGVARTAFPDFDVASLEVWRTAWDVEPLALPAADHENPIRHDRLIAVAPSPEGGR
jgi:hypothetical protein